MNTSETPGASVLFRKAALDLGDLIGQHVKVAQLELKVELHALVGHALRITLLAALVLLGYGLAVAGLTVQIVGHPSIGIPLALIGAVHVAGAGVGLILALAHTRGSQHMKASSRAMARSLEALKEVKAPSVEGHHVA